jgi:hypothetical protein
MCMTWSRLNIYRTTCPHMAPFGSSYSVSSAVFSSQNIYVVNIYTEYFFSFTTDRLYKSVEDMPNGALESVKCSLLS